MNELERQINRVHAVYGEDFLADHMEYKLVTGATLATYAHALPMCESYRMYLQLLIDHINMGIRRNELEHKDDHMTRAALTIREQYTYMTEICNIVRSPTARMRESAIMYVNSVITKKWFASLVAYDSLTRASMQEVKALYSSSVLADAVNIEDCGYFAITADGALSELTNLFADEPVLDSVVSTMESYNIEGDVIDGALDSLVRNADKELPQRIFSDMLTIRDSLEQGSIVDTVRSYGARIHERNSELGCPTLPIKHASTSQGTIDIVSTDSTLGELLPLGSKVYSSRIYRFTRGRLLSLWVDCIAKHGHTPLGVAMYLAYATEVVTRVGMVLSGDNTDPYIDMEVGILREIGSAYNL